MVKVSHANICGVLLVLRYSVACTIDVSISITDAIVFVVTHMLSSTESAYRRDRQHVARLRHPRPSRTYVDKCLAESSLAEGKHNRLRYASGHIRLGRAAPCAKGRLVQLGAAIGQDIHPSSIHIIAC